MKKIIAFVLILIICFSNTEMYQLLKMPKLISHFIQHKNKSATSFYDFLKLHYSGKHEKDDDANDDRQLPFNSDECINSSTLYLPVTISTIVQIQNKPVNHYKSLYQSFCPTDFISKIFQPPRFGYFL